MLHFKKSDKRWWQKPLVIHLGKYLPAELAVLDIECRPKEQGVWLNSRSSTSGVIDLIPENDSFKTKRIDLPAFVSDLLSSIYETANLTKGAPDLILWNSTEASARLVEVKNPHWDNLSKEQNRFLQIAEDLDILVSVVKWEFVS